MLESEAYRPQDTMHAFYSDNIYYIRNQGCLSRVFFILGNFFSKKAQKKALINRKLPKIARFLRTFPESGAANALNFAFILDIGRIFVYNRTNHFSRRAAMFSNIGKKIQLLALILAGLSFVACAALGALCLISALDAGVDEAPLASSIRLAISGLRSEAGR